MRKALTISFYIVAAFYAVIMMDLLFRFNYLIDTERVISRTYNLVPFRTITAFIGELGGKIEPFAISNLLGNVVLFIPCGVYVMVMQKRGRFAKSILILVCVFVAVETVQFAFGLGVGDVDDVLLNTLGGMIGILCYLFFVKLLGNEAKARTAIQIISLIVGVPVICIYCAAALRYALFEFPRIRRGNLL